MKKIMIVLSVIFCLFLLSGCVSEKRTIKTLQKAGYTNIEATNWKPFSCGDEDWFRTGFKANNTNGKMIDGVVCCGLIFKDCTIRY